MSEHLELLANGEVLARYYRHPANLAHAVKAGASWEQIGAARGASAEQARQDYREWAEGQHHLWTGTWGASPAGPAWTMPPTPRRSAAWSRTGRPPGRTRRWTRAPSSPGRRGPARVQGCRAARGVPSGA